METLHILVLLVLAAAPALLFAVGYRSAALREHRKARAEVQALLLELVQLQAEQTRLDIDLASLRAARRR